MTSSGLEQVILSLLDFQVFSLNPSRSLLIQWFANNGSESVFCYSKVIEGGNKN
jgi:hypothetical protein